MAIAGDEQNGKASRGSGPAGPAPNALPAKTGLLDADKRLSLILATMATLHVAHGALAGSLSSDPVSSPPPETITDPLTQLTAATTGCRIAEASLKKVSDFATSEDGQVVTGLYVTGRVTVKHRNVRFTDCVVEAADQVYGFIPEGTTSGTHIEWCTIRGPKDLGVLNAIAPDGWSVYRCNIYWCQNGFNLWGPCDAIENWVHDLYQKPGGPGGDPHYDCFQDEGAGGGYSILRNRFENVYEQTSAIFLQNKLDPKIIDKVVIDGNYLAGGGYTIYADDRSNPGKITNVSITNNVIKAGRYGTTSFYSSGVRLGLGNKII